MEETETPMESQDVIACAAGHQTDGWGDDTDAQPPDNDGTREDPTT